MLIRVADGKNIDNQKIGEGCLEYLEQSYESISLY